MRKKHLRVLRVRGESMIALAHRRLHRAPLAGIPLVLPDTARMRDVRVQHLVISPGHRKNFATRQRSHAGQEDLAILLPHLEPWSRLQPSWPEQEEAQPTLAARQTRRSPRAETRAPRARRSPFQPR